MHSEPADMIELPSSTILPVAKILWATNHTILPVRLCGPPQSWQQDCTYGAHSTTVPARFHPIDEHE